MKNEVLQISDLDWINWKIITSYLRYHVSYSTFCSHFTLIFCNNKSNFVYKSSIQWPILQTQDSAFCTPALVHSHINSNVSSLASYEFKMFLGLVSGDPFSKYRVLPHVHPCTPSYASDVSSLVLYEFKMFLGLVSGDPFYTDMEYHLLSASFISTQTCFMTWWTTSVETSVPSSHQSYMFYGIKMYN